MTICLKKEKLYFMPDKLLIVSGKNIGAIAYDNLTIQKKDYPFIEDDSVPKDTEIIRHTWLKVNKDGSPDKRFKGNRQIPVCKYGLITLENDSGFNVKICCSNNALIHS